MKRFKQEENDIVLEPTSTVVPERREVVEQHRLMAEKAKQDQEAQK